MKKLLLVSLILLSWILLAACEKKSDDNMDNLSCTSWDDGCEIAVDSVENTWKNVVENQESNVIENQEFDKIVDIEECKNVVQKYLDESDKEWKWEEVKEWDNITVDYIWRLDDGTVFDTSVESVAKACGKYIVGRNYEEWLTFDVWAGKMIKWFDEWVVWMKVWQTKTVGISPENGYGLYDESLLLTAPISEVWDISGLSEWDTVFMWNWYARVAKITDEEITFDFNHELAGKTLIFDITLKEISD